MDARRLSSTAAEWAESVHGLSDVLWIDTALLIIICVLVGFVVYRMTFSAGESAAAAAPTEQSALIGEKKPAEEGNAEGASAAAEESGAAAPLSSCLLYTSPSPRDGLLSRMPSSA